MGVSRLAEVPGIGVDRMGNAADAADDPEMLRLENLDTDIPPPPDAIEATRAAVGRDDANSYLPFLGTDALRRAATAHVSALSGRHYDWRTDCLIAAGGLSGVLNALLAMLEPGDEVVLTDPAYAGLINRVRIADGVPRFVPLSVVDGVWRLDLEALRAAASDRTRVVLTMSPSMPSGLVHTAAEWNAVADLCDRTGAWHLYDAAMERILFDGLPLLHPAAHDGLGPRTVTVGSVSKEYRMIGWRVGWVVAPRSLLADIALVSLSNVVCQVGIAMPGAVAALTAADDGIADAVRTWEARRDTILTELDGMPVIRPQGGWSMLIDTAAMGHGPADASALLFDRARIAATPMTGWGADERAGRYLRLVFANEPVDRLRGIGVRIRDALDRDPPRPRA